MTGLVKKIDQRLAAAAGKTPRTAGVYVLFDNQGEGLDKRLRDVAEKESLKCVSLCIGGPPKPYDVNPEADVTVVIYNLGRRGEQKVTANFALRKGELDTAKTDAILRAVQEMLPKE